MLITIVIIFFALVSHVSGYGLRIPLKTGISVHSRWLQNLRKETSCKLQVSSSFSIAAMADYAAEVQNAVGPEIYGPIFKAGIFLVVSGFASAAITTFLISRNDSWELLEEEFQTGKMEQLLKMEQEQADNENKAAVQRSNSDELDLTNPAGKSLDDIDL